MPIIRSVVSKGVEFSRNARDMSLPIVSDYLIVCDEWDGGVNDNE